MISNKPYSDRISRSPARPQQAADDARHSHGIDRRTDVCTIQSSAHSAFDPLFIAGLRSWLGDIHIADAELSTDQLAAVLEAQREWSKAGDPLLKEMKLVLATIRRAVAKGRPHARLARARTLRAFERAGVPTELLSAPQDKYQNPQVAHETAEAVAKKPEGGLRRQERVFPEGTEEDAPREQRGMKGK